MTDKCDTKDIFAIGLDGLLPKHHADAYVLVYAPLSDCGIIVSKSEWNAIKQSIDGNCNLEPDLADIAMALTDEDHDKLKKSAICGIDDFQNLSILPNNKCNFKCSFCYSAEGRANDELQLWQAKMIIDRFIRPDSPEKLSLSILGGGEPLLSWPLVKECIEYAENRAWKFDKKIYTSITTNGSLITDDIIEYFKRHNINTVVSYEILEDIQNLHRGHYQIVRNNIKRMFYLGYTPQFNTVITPENVDRLKEVVETAHVDFPDLGYLCTDPVISTDIFSSVNELRTFHDKFINGFFEARDLGNKYGLKVDCTANLCMDCTLTRYCPGEMGLTATGMVTSCPCVSSERESGFDAYVYGRVSREGVNFDMDCLKKILAKDVYSNAKCRACPMKYNCGGGCMHKNNIFPYEFVNETCRFTREFGRRYLFEQINASYLESCGNTIIEMIENA